MLNLKTSSTNICNVLIIDISWEGLLMNTKAVFARRLKCLREEKGLSQSELGEQLGVSRGTISFYESQKRTADIEFLAAASKFFDVDYDYLMGVSNARIGKNEAQKTLDDMGLSDDTINFIKEQNSQYMTNPINILCGDNLPEIDGENVALTFFKSIMLYYLYTLDAEEQSDDATIQTTESGVIVSFNLAAELFLYYAKEYLSVIIKHSMGVLPFANFYSDETSMISYEILLHKTLKAINHHDEEQYQLDIENFANKNREWEKKVKDGTAAESEYLQWLKDVKEKKVAY